MLYSREATIKMFIFYKRWFFTKGKTGIVIDMSPERYVLYREKNTSSQSSKILSNNILFRHYNYSVITLDLKQKNNNKKKIMGKERAHELPQNPPANMYMLAPYGQNLGIYPIQVLHGPHIGFFAHIRPIYVPYW